MNTCDNMDFYKVINTRRTMRDFEDVSIPEDIIKKILSAGFKAPSNDHMRDWHFIVITDKAVALKCIEKIPMEFSDEDVNAILHDWNLTDECQKNAYKNAIPKQYRMLIEASCMVIPVFKQKTNILKPENLSHLNGFASMWCSIENIFLAATAEGYACTLRIPLGDEGEWVRKVMQIPEDYLVPCYIGIGKTKENADVVKQKEIDIDSRIHFNKWG